MAVSIVNPSDAVEAQRGSYKDQAVRNFNGSASALWYGRATVPAAGAAANVDIIRYEPQLDFEGNLAFTIPANSLIHRIAMFRTGPLIMGAATGKIKIAPTLTNSTAGLYLSSPAAAANSLAANTGITYTDSGFSQAGVSVGASDVTYKLFATDGGAPGAEVASTMRATEDTDVIVAIAFTCLDRLIPPSQVFKKPDRLNGQY